MRRKLVLRYVYAAERKLIVQRRALSKKDASRITLRTKKGVQAFPTQKYALRA